MKKTALRIATFDDPSVWKKIEAQLRRPGVVIPVKKPPTYRSSELIYKQGSYDLSFYQPTKNLKKIRHDWIVGKCAEVGLSYFDLFRYFVSSVVVFPMTKSKEPLLVFKSLGRVPGELRFSFLNGKAHINVYPFAVYWKGEFHKSWPLELKSKYPAITTPLFWQQLSRHSEISEVPLALTSSAAYGKSFSLINKTLRYLGLISEKRGASHEMSDHNRKCCAIVIAEYDRLCRADAKYRKRIPVKKLADHLAGSNVDGGGAQDFQTIRRWIKKYDREATKRNELLRAFDKSGVMILSAPKMITAALLVDLSTSK